MSIFLGSLRSTSSSSSSAGSSWNWDKAGTDSISQYWQLPSSASFNKMKDEKDFNGKIYSMKHIPLDLSVATIMLVLYHLANYLTSGQNGQHFEDIFQFTFLISKSHILIKLSFKFAPKSTIDNESALVQVMVCRRTGNKPLPEPMMTMFTDVYVDHQASSATNVNSLVPGRFQINFM